MNGSLFNLIYHGLSHSFLVQACTLSEMEGGAITAEIRNQGKDLHLLNSPHPLTFKDYF